MLKNKISSVGKLSYATKKNHKDNILKYKFEYVEEKLQNQDGAELGHSETLKKGSTGIMSKTDKKSSNNIFSMMKTMNKNDLEKE
jgi:hypothetical protein